MVHKFFCVFFLLFSFDIFAVEENDIIGFWCGPPDKNGRSVVIEFFKKKNTFSGVAVAFKYENQIKEEKSKKDISELKNMALALAEITSLFDLEFDHGEWKHGKIHNPVAQKDFSISVRLSKDLKTAFIRVSLDRYGLIGINTEWKRCSVEDEKIYKTLMNP